MDLTGPAAPPLPPERLEAALAWLRPRLGEMTQLLRPLVEINSHTGNLAGIEACQLLYREVLARLPLEVELVDASEPRFGKHLVARSRGQGAGARPVLLIGHMDTVFRPGTFEGYREEGGRAFGPGVLDMKGGLVVIAFALRALHEVRALEGLPLSIFVVSDEEVGSPSSQPMLREAARAARSALVFESGRANDAIVTRRKGTAGFNVTAHGKAAHAGNAHAEGVNALWALARFVDRAQRLTDYDRGRTVNVGRVEGGQGKNTVPDRATAQVDLRFLTRADGEALVEALREAAAAAAAEVPGARLEVEGAIARMPLEPQPGQAELLAAYAACARAAGLGADEAALQGGGSDANTVSACGLPAIDALGPRGTGFHTADEWIELATLVQRAEALVRLLAGFRG